MTTATMTTAAPSPRAWARIAGAFYLLNFVSGSVALVLGRNAGAAGIAANLVAESSYVVVTLLFYRLFRPVHRTLSLLAVLFSLAGCAAGALNLLSPVRSPVNPLVFFGVYCLLIGYLILKSTFLPRILGMLLSIGGLGWLTFALPALARKWSPYNMTPGIFGEGVLILWLLVVGLNPERWREQATIAGE